ncbi:hypothetical protein GA0115247_12411, partial [Streptomyces sp. PalvLS-984]
MTPGIPTTTTTSHGPGTPAPDLAAGGLLPEDGTAGSLLARVWNPDADGPSPAAVRADGVYDISGDFSTVSLLCEEKDPAAALGQ